MKEKKKKKKLRYIGSYGVLDVSTVLIKSLLRLPAQNHIHRRTPVELAEASVNSCIPNDK